MAAAGCGLTAAPVLAQASSNTVSSNTVSSGIDPTAPLALRPQPARANPAQRPVGRLPAAPTRGTVREATSQPVAVLPASAAPAAAPRRRRTVDDPYAPLGLRLGNVTLLPSIEQSIGRDTNPNRTGGVKKGTAFWRTDGEVKIQSDWGRDELTGNLRGGYSRFFDAPEADRPDGEGKLTYRHDFTRRTKGTLETRFAITTERPGSPDAVSGAVNRPIVASYGAEAGLSHQFNRLTLGLRGALDRVSYQKAELANGLALDQADRDYNQYGLKLRASYELTPGLIPFIEATVDRRQRDEAIDSSGYARSSDGAGIRAGTTFEITRTLTGEASAGYQLRRYEDARLRDLRGPTADAALIWSVTPLTTVTLSAATTLDETSVVGASGTITRRAGLEVRHDLRRNVTLIGTAAMGRGEYDGAGITEDTRSVGAKIDYKLTRSLVVRASFTHERLKSTVRGSDYTANTYLVGLRLQK